jgi:hypothetical protein
MDISKAARRITNYIIDSIIINKGNRLALNLNDWDLYPLQGIACNEVFLFQSIRRILKEEEDKSLQIENPLTGTIYQAKAKLNKGDKK